MPEPLETSTGDAIRVELRLEDAPASIDLVLQPNGAVNAVIASLRPEEARTLARTLAGCADEAESRRDEAVDS